MIATLSKTISSFLNFGKSRNQNPPTFYNISQSPLPPPTSWPSPNFLIRPITQSIAHIVSTFIMVLLILFSFVEDFYRSFMIAVTGKDPLPEVVASSLDGGKFVDGVNVHRVLRHPKPHWGMNGDDDQAFEDEDSATAVDDEGEEEEEEFDDDDEDEDVEGDGAGSREMDSEEERRVEFRFRKSKLNGGSNNSKLARRRNVNSSPSAASSSSTCSTSTSTTASPVKKTVSNVKSTGSRRRLHQQQQQQQQQQNEVFIESSSSQTVDDDEELVSSRVEDYCEKFGYSCVAYDAVTQDGFILVLHRVGRKDGVAPTRGPVILMHGLFQSSGVWITNGKESFAFYLVDQGYDVWMGNNRAVFERHLTLKTSDPRFWNWSLDELALYDVPTMLSTVRHHTKTEKVAFIGHSQGNAQMFLALHHNPALNSQLSVFVALAPAVYLGALLQSFPVSLLMNCPNKWHRRIFGVNAFLPIMTLVQKWFPPVVFMTLAYHMFHYLFGWTDTNWNRAKKNAYFQFTPRPQSSKSIHHWGQMGRTGVIQPFDPNLDSDESTFPTSASMTPPPPKRHHRFTASTDPSRSHVAHFDVSVVKCPLALYYGNKDTIVDGPELYQRCWDAKVNLVAVEEVAGFEHLDPLWSRDAKDKVWKRVDRMMRGLKV
ncbi:hypothetical protein HDU76_008340 [Blyttiomyces sp. JEL0837]|nr:hypothetical protein HDU76_008340 [Blyttiomyces sp. JEL0837]